MGERALRDRLIATDLDREDLEEVLRARLEELRRNRDARRRRGPSRRRRGTRPSR